MKEDINTQKGVKIDITVGQFLSVVLLIVILFVLPVGGYEYLNGRFNTGSKEVYTSASLSDSSSTSNSGNEGKVAGISTSKVEEKVEGAGDTLSFVASSTTLLIAGGITLISFSLILSGTVIYDFWKK